NKSLIISSIKIIYSFNLLLILLGSSSFHFQDSKSIKFENELHTRINWDIYHKNYQLASLRCDTFRREAIDINSKESIKLLQVYLKAHRSDAASEALRLCLVKGVPLWMLRNNEITKTIFTNDTFKPILTHYDSFRNVYFQSIETQAK